MVQATSAARHVKKLLSKPSLYSAAALGALPGLNHAEPIVWIAVLLALLHGSFSLREGIAFGKSLTVFPTERDARSYSEARLEQIDPAAAKSYRESWKSHDR